MSEYSNVDLLSIQRLKEYLNSQIYSDPLKNLNLSPEQTKEISELEPLVLAVISATDLNQYYQMRDAFNNFKNKSGSLQWFLANTKTTFFEALINFEEIYMKEQKKHLFETVISSMTGSEFNQYLQFIGVVKS